MTARKTKVDPATPAEGEIKQQATDAATPPADDQSVANDNQAQALQAEQHAAQEPGPGDAVAGLFEPNAIEVVAKCESFRRAGRVFTRDVSTIRLTELTDTEFTLLYQEPMLAVQLTHLAEED